MKFERLFLHVFGTSNHSHTVHVQFEQAISNRHRHCYALNMQTPSKEMVTSNFSKLLSEGPQEFPSFLCHIKQMNTLCCSGDPKHKCGTVDEPYFHLPGTQSPQANFYSCVKVFWSDKL